MNSNVRSVSPSGSCGGATMNDSSGITPLRRQSSADLERLVGARALADRSSVAGRSASRRRCRPCAGGSCARAPGLGRQIHQRIGARVAPPRQLVPRQHFEQRHHLHFAIEEVVIVELDRIGADLRLEKRRGRDRAARAGGNAVAPRNIAATPQNVQRNRQPSAAWCAAVRCPRNVFDEIRLSVGEQFVTAARARCARA